jgi:hypothetical protein
VSRWLSGVSRAGLALTLSLLVLAVLRWGPVHAEPPVDVRALPLAGPAVILAVLGGITGRERRPRPARPFLVALALVAGALAAVVAARGPAGLPVEVSDGREVLARLPPGPVDIIGSDLRGVAGPRRSLHWQGPLRAPASGTYRLWAVGRGRVRVELDGRTVLEADGGERLRAGTEVPIGRGEHALDVRLEWAGPGPHLRLGWTRPRAGGRPGGRDEAIPPRYLGAVSSPLLWAVTDLLALLLAGLVAALVLVLPWDQPRRPPAPLPATRSQIGVSLAAYVILLAVMSWPLVLDLAGRGPVDRPDGRLNAWILAWDVHALLHEPGRLFQAPIFHPLPDALAFSENLLLPAILSAPALLGGGPVLAYNLSLLLSLALSGLGVEMLVRRVSGDRLAAFVAGACFAAGAHRWTRLAHLHAQVTLFLPFALLALDRFWARRTLGRALLVGLLLALQGLASLYLGAITAAALGAALAVGLLGGLKAPDLLKLAAGFLLAGLLLAPVARPYLRMRAFQGMEFTLETVAVYATTLPSYAASGVRLYGPLTQRHLDPEAVQDALFPGLAVLALGLVGLAAAPARYRAVALAASALAVVLSLGPQTAFYRFLHEHFVLVRGIRALSRFSLVPVLALSVLAGLALAGRRWTTSVVALLLMMLESSNMPLRLGVYEGPPAVARWLSGGEGAVAYLPLGERDTQVMLDGIAHFRPLLNGDSGFIPRPYDRALELLEGPLTPEGLRFLRAVGVRHIVTGGALGWPPAAAFGGERVYEVPEGSRAESVDEGTAAPTLWTSGGVIADLGQERTVSRVSFELSDGPWNSRPRVRASADGTRWEEVEAEASLADATLSLVKDPRLGRGEVRFPERRARFLLLDRSLPARPGTLGVRP